jgi:hypothetical protein
VPVEEFGMVGAVGAASQSRGEDVFGARM